MDCSNCGSPSALVYKIKKDGAEKEVCLCADCYERLYPKKDTSELFAHVFGKSNSQPKKASNCPSCGMTLESFQRSGLLGCAGCYSAFRREIMNAVRYCQWGGLHLGKTPSGDSAEKYDLVREYEAVKSQMDAALLSGNYRLAEEVKRRLQAVYEKLTRTEGEEE